jgi:hypothetical protein
VIVQQAIPYRRPATHPSRGVVHVAGNTEMPISQSPQPAPLGQGNDRNQSRRRHEVRVIEHRASHRVGMRSCIREMPFLLV